MNYTISLVIRIVAIFTQQFTLAHVRTLSRKNKRFPEISKVTKGIETGVRTIFSFTCSLESRPSLSLQCHMGTMRRGGGSAASIIVFDDCCNIWTSVSRAAFEWWTWQVRDVLFVLLIWEFFPLNWNFFCRKLLFCVFLCLLVPSNRDLEILSSQPYIK